jgi:hypothetical protein
VTFTRPDTWLREWRGLPPVQDAARIAIPAYLRAHGPATMATFHAWLAPGPAAPPRSSPGLSTCLI